MASNIAKLPWPLDEPTLALVALFAGGKLVGDETIDLALCHFRGFAFGSLTELLLCGCARER